MTSYASPPVTASHRCNQRFLAACSLTFLVLAVSATAADEPLQFNRDIRPILSAKCFACHGPDANQREADLRLDVEQAAKEHAIVPGEPDESEFMLRVTSDDPDTLMPPADSKSTLTPEEIDLLRRWIEAGAPYERHWSFVPPKQLELPAVRDTQWARTPIDRFVLARLEQEGLRPSPEADRYALIRRVTLDLTGVPPTVAETDAFVADSSSDAWEKVVDRLLQSDRYGEHMARYWLDAARYADTNGYQYDLEREQWVWRDWVIAAFNSNMPFDQFTVEQIAGDLLPNATDQQRLATAFHRNHPITIEGGVIDEEYRTEYVIDRVVTTATTWMGLTMTCGRCHDHKYDPISQREFYQFFAFFNQVPERGLNGFDPKIKVESPLRSAESERLDQQLADGERRLAQLVADSADNLAEWEKRLASLANQWTIVVPRVRKSQGGADLTVQPDQSLLATGKNPQFEVYEFVIDCESPIHAIRLEALTHASFVGGGTGRGDNGNFVLSEFQVAAAGAESPDEFQPVKIESAQADYSQKNYDIRLAIDGKIDRSGWAVDGNTRQENRVAVFRLAQPLLPNSTASVRVQLHHGFGGSHHIGRLRLAVAERPVETVPADVAAFLQVAGDQRTAAQQNRLQEYLCERFGSRELQQAVADLRAHRRRRDEVTGTPATMVMAELAKPRKTHVLFRGEYDKPRDEVSAGTPGMLPPLPEAFPRNRLGLARWLTMPDHPLTARVAVNRFWQSLFGTGLVKTAEDFGSQGEWPSHPELLDWMAVDLVESGWDVKRMLKQIVMSATYRQASGTTESLRQRDPENRLLARGPRLRMDAEVIRDSALFASGLLSERLGGPSVFPYHPPGLWQEINNRPGYSRVYKQDSGEKLYRRSLYTFWKRTVPPPSMAAFDAPQREYCVARRSRTNTPLQAFVMLHDPQFVEAARHLGQRMITEGGATTEARITYGFRLCYARRPDAAELSALSDILADRLRQYRADGESAANVLAVGQSPRDESLDPAQWAAFTTIARVLLNLSELVTKS